MNIVFKSTLVAVLLSVSSSTSNSSNLPSLADVYHNMDNYMRHKTLYSSRDDKKFHLVKVKEEYCYGQSDQTYAKIDDTPLSPKYYNIFPWIGDYQTYVIQKANSAVRYFLTISEVRTQ